MILDTSDTPAVTDKILSHLGFRAAFLAGQKTGHGLVDVVTVGADTRGTVTRAK